MRWIVGVLLLFSGGFSVHYQGEVALKSVHYATTQDEKRSHEMLYWGEFQLSYERHNHGVLLTVEGLKSEQDSEKHYGRIDELLYRYTPSWGEISFGKRVLFWGSLEGYNLTDVFNTKTALFPYSPYEKEEKLGSWQASYRYFGEAWSGAVLFKLREEEVKYGDSASPENPFRTSPLPYDQRVVCEESCSDPTLFVHMEGSVFEGLGEYGAFYQEGYSNERAILRNREALHHYVPLIKRGALYGTYEADEMLYKIEFHGTKPSHQARTYALGAGIERSFYDALFKGDLTLYVEYFKSDSRADSVFKSDLFTALRWVANDTAGTEWSVGSFYDTSCEDWMIQGEWKRRFGNATSMKVRYLQIEADKKRSPMGFLDHHRALKAELHYYF